MPPLNIGAPPPKVGAPATTQAASTAAHASPHTPGGRRRADVGCRRAGHRTAHMIAVVSFIPSVAPPRARRSLAPRPRIGGWGAHHERARGRTPSATRAVGRREGSARRALSVSSLPRLSAAFCWGVDVDSFVPSDAPRTPLSRSEAPLLRVGRAPRASARTHSERHTRGRPALGVCVPRALGESVAAFVRRFSLGGWRQFIRLVRLPPRATLSLRGPAPAGRARDRRARSSRVALAAAVEQGCSRHCCDLPVFSVAGRRPCLACFLWSPLRAERGSGARSDRRRARDARGARVHHGWLSPPQSSRGVRALCWSSPLPLLFVSVDPRVPLPRSTRAGEWRAHHERSSRLTLRARRSLAPRPSRRRVELAPQEGARMHAERDARGRPALGVRMPRALGESVAASRAAFRWGFGVVSFDSSVAPPRARHSSAPRSHAGRKGAHHERARGRTPSATHALGRRGESARHAFSVSPRTRSCAAFRWGFDVVCSCRSSPRARRSLAPSPRAGG